MTSSLLSWRMLLVKHMQWINQHCVYSTNLKTYFNHLMLTRTPLCVNRSLHRNCQIDVISSNVIFTTACIVTKCAIYLILGRVIVILYSTAMSLTLQLPILIRKLPFAIYYELSNFVANKMKCDPLFNIPHHAFARFTRKWLNGSKLH